MLVQYGLQWPTGHKGKEANRGVGKADDTERITYTLIGHLVSNFEINYGNRVRI
jgi:hypothetical protein